MGKDHLCYGYIINCAFLVKNYLSKMVCYSIGVYTIKSMEHYMVTWRSKIFLLVLKNISLVCNRRESSYLRAAM